MYSQRHGSTLISSRNEGEAGSWRKTVCVCTRSAQYSVHTCMCVSVSRQDEAEQGVKMKDGEPIDMSLLRKH